MAGRAIDRLALVIGRVVRQTKRSVSLVVERLSIQPGRLPSGRIVALLATGLEDASMTGWLRVTIHASRRDPTEQVSTKGNPFSGCFSRASIRVTLRAAHRAVLAFQREAGCGMIELRQAILAVMANQAVDTKILVVLEHER